jgi:hypothetical protein
MFWVNFHAGLLRVEGGVGVGFTFLNGLAQSVARDVVSPVFSASLSGRAAVTLAVAVTRFLDVVLVTDVSFGFAVLTATAAGFAPRFAEAQAASCLGMQGRFWQ